MDLLISEIRQQVKALNVLCTLGKQNVLLCKELLKEIEELIYSEEDQKVYKDKQKLKEMISEIQNYLKIIQKITGAERFHSSLENNSSSVKISDPDQSLTSTNKNDDPNYNQKRNLPDSTASSSSSQVDIKPAENKDKCEKRPIKQDDQVSITQNEDEILVDVIDEFDDTRLNLELEKISKMCRKDEKLLFLIKWKEFEKPAFVQNSVAREKYPVELIHFYQNFAKWMNGKGILEESVGCISHPEEVDAYKMGIQRLKQEDGNRLEKILGATDILGELSFLVLWTVFDGEQETKEADLVPAKLMNEKHPELVLDFYEESTSVKI